MKSDRSVANTPAARAMTRTSVLRSAGIIKMMRPATSGVKVMTVRKGKFISFTRAGRSGGEQPGDRGVYHADQPGRPDADDDQERHERRDGQDFARRNLQAVPDPFCVQRAVQRAADALQ